LAPIPKFDLVAAKDKALVFAGWFCNAAMCIYGEPSDLHVPRLVSAPTSYLPLPKIPKGPAISQADFTYAVIPQQPGNPGIENFNSAIRVNGSGVVPANLHLSPFLL